MTSSRSHSTALTFHKGKESSISHLENEVLDWFHEQTAHGLVVLVNMLSNTFVPDTWRISLSYKTITSRSNSLFIEKESNCLQGCDA